MSFLTKIFGDANQKVLGSLQARVEKINSLEDKFKAFSAKDFKKQTSKWQEMLQGKDLSARGGPALGWEEQQKILDEILPKAFASVREAALRTLNQRHYDVQLIAGLVLHQGNIAEMKTGEGKTLASTVAIYLNALTGRGVHVITVNDYLSRRDMVWMGQIYDYLGLSVGCLNHQVAYLYDREYKGKEEDKERDELGSFKVVEEFLKPVPRQEAYAADITYGTNNEFGFDYLRDNMVQSHEQKVQRELHYAIIDEVDSILIDEARTPLIISAPDTQPTDKYRQFAQLVTRLKEKDHYEVDEKARAVTLTEEGIKKMEDMLGVENIYTERGMREVHHIEQALKAHVLFKKDKDYVVVPAQGGSASGGKDGQVIIVDEFTGRLMHGRRYSEGLHQAIEAKEGVEVQRESITMATITFQNLFRMYAKLAGMTGTAATEAEELSKIYDLDVVIIPTNRPLMRQDKSDVIYKSVSEKYTALVQEIKACHEKGQPVLVGTISIENNELLSNMLEREGVPHKVLNAKQHESEAQIIAQAGKKGAVTIATNMAGRGVDIVLGGNPADKAEQDEVLKLGGLHVLGSERHESRRIDNQLRGRAGRQGDPGSSQFFVSMEDDLMRIFGGDRMKALMSSLGAPEGMPIENKIISSSIEKAQAKVEGHNFDIRKHLVEYDDVINAQRETIYKRRARILEKQADTKNLVLENPTQEIEGLAKSAEQVNEENTSGLIEALNLITELTADEKVALQKYKTVQELKIAALELIKHKYNELEEKINNDPTFRGQLKEGTIAMRVIERTILLRAIDMLWVEHIDAMDSMRRGIGLRGYGQKDPLVEYKKEAFRMFNELLANIRKQVVYTIFKVGVAPPQPQPRQDVNFSGPAKSGSVSSSAPKNGKIKKKVGRNDPCPCGATKPDGTPKKYKHCCGK